MADGSHAATLTICNEKGLHARATAKFVRCVGAYEAHVDVEKDGETVVGTSIMGLLMLGACKGSNIDVRATGPQAEEVIQALRALVENRFEEDK